MKNWYEIKAAADGEAAEVYIYAEIGEDLWGDGSSVSAREFVKDLNAISSPEIALHLNSPGGAVFDGQAIYTALKNHPARVTTYIDGLAASIASVIALAGDSVVMAENALFMIHEPHGWASGTAEAMRTYATLLEKSGAAMRGVYEARSALTEEEVAEAMKAETWYLAEEALEAGFVDDVADNIPAAAIARFDPKALGFKHVPPALLERLAPEGQTGDAPEAPEPAPASGAADDDSGDSPVTLTDRAVYLLTQTRHGGSR